MPIERYRLSFIQAVDDLAGAHPILVRFAKVIAERLACEQTLRHAKEQYAWRVVELQRQIGMMNEVDPQQVRHRFVIALPGELDETSAVIDLSRARISLSIWPSASFAIFIDRLHVLISLVVGRRKSVGEPPVVIG